MEEPKEPGSRKMINGAEVWTVRNFPVDSGIEGSAAMFETVDGSFIYYNGQPVDKLESFVGLPEQHKARAIAWWEKNYGDGTHKTPEPINSPLQKVQEDVFSMLLAKLSAMEADIAALKGVGKPVESEEDVPQKNKVGRPKLSKGDEVLKEMGIQV